ncbi:hypothetical protein C172_07029 [Paenibacillus sp. FSL H8-457]|nr:hypothetical protein C172_07029 [Paenibacillus sp. FSL H8-457]
MSCTILSNMIYIIAPHFFKRYSFTFEGEREFVEGYYGKCFSNVEERVINRINIRPSLGEYIGWAFYLH